MVDATQVLLSLLIFAGVFLPIYAIFRFPVAASAPVNRRIARALGADRATVFERPGIGPVLSVFVSLASRLNLPKIRRDVRQDLDASGNASGYTVDQFLAICLSCSVVVGVSGALLESLLGGGLLLVVLPACAIAGFYIPLILLHGARTRRVIRIAKQLPYTLDLVALVMAAGSSFGEAIETMIRDNPDDDLNQELRIALSEMDFGTGRADALRHLAERIPLESLRSVIAAINQSEKLGTPMSAILKVQADMLRSARGVVAEKKSASASLRILVPSMMIMIAVITIVFSPIIIRFMKGELF